MTHFVSLITDTSPRGNEWRYKNKATEIADTLVSICGGRKNQEEESEEFIGYYSPQQSAAR